MAGSNSSHSPVETSKLQESKGQEDPAGRHEERDRRAFLGQVAWTGAAGVLLGTQGAAQQSRSLTAPLAPPCDDAALGPEKPKQRRSHAFHVRVEAARQQAHAPLPCHERNQDEALYPDQRGSYSKGLVHDSIGEVDPGSYASLLAALENGDHAAFELIQLGNPGGA